MCKSGMLLQCDSWILYIYVEFMHCNEYHTKCTTAEYHKLLISLMWVIGLSQRDESPFNVWIILIGQVLINVVEKQSYQHSPFIQYLRIYLSNTMNTISSNQNWGAPMNFNCLLMRQWSKITFDGCNR